MALPAPTPLYATKQIPFSAQYTCERNLHLWHTKRKKVTGEISNCIKKNLGTCKHIKQSLLPIEIPGERKYTSNLKKQFALTLYKSALSKTCSNKTRTVH